jgi:hypothetical protein
MMMMMMMIIIIIIILIIINNINGMSETKMELSVILSLVPYATAAELHLLN